ncbi:MAG TPA: arginyltransferase [Rectinemataceae bacterium]|nr:arginyltransferase [Rectinemataceae bacterium]
MRATKLFPFSEPCPYVEGRSSSGEFLVGEESFDHYEALMPSGWRRSGGILYRYRCEGCSRCIPIRLPVSRALAGKRLSRLRRLNRDIAARLLPADFRDEHFRLYEKYIRARHGETFRSAEEPESSIEESYRSMLRVPMAAVTEYRDASGKLCAVGFLDMLPNGLSSVYFAFAPDECRRSLGSYSVFAEAELAAGMGKEYYYLGFWVPGVAKMDYKADFPPFQLALNPASWRESGDPPPRWVEFANKTEALSWLSSISHR